MNRFKWPLQRVLDVRIIEEKTKSAELFKLTQQLSQTQAELLIQMRILEDMISSISEKTARSRLSEQEFFLKYSIGSDEKINALREKIKKLEIEQKEKIAELLKVKKFKEGMEKLLDEAKKDFVKEQEKLEQKQADEQSGINYARKKISSRVINAGTLP